MGFWCCGRVRNSITVLKFSEQSGMKGHERLRAWEIGWESCGEVFDRV
jgi:hypothetical protein